MFLLPPETQTLVIRKVAKALNPNGKLLFSAPPEAVCWNDALSGRESVWLGSEEHRRILEESGLRRNGQRRDEGGNHYCLASKALRTGL